MSVSVIESRARGLSSGLSVLQIYSSGGAIGLAPDALVPTLALDFTVGTLDSRITFARSDATTCATYFGSDGLLKPAAANVPRFDYDPVTLIPKGLLIEESRTNLLLNTATLSTQSVTTAATAYTLSFYGTGSITLSGTSTGTVAGTGASNRVTSTFTPTAGSLTLTVSGSVAYAQLEAGSFATSVIICDGTSRTRAADAASMTGTNFSSWWNASEGTFVVSGDVSTANSQQCFACADDGTLNNRVELSLGGTGRARSQYAIGSVTLIDNSLSSGADYRGIALKYAFGWSSANGSLYTNGTSISLGTNSTTTSLPANRLLFGNRSASGVQLNGHIRRIVYFNKRLPDATLKAVTL